MSNNFIKNDIDDLLSSIQSENIPLPQWLNIVDRSNTETSEENYTAMNNIALSNTSFGNEIATNNDATSEQGH